MAESRYPTRRQALTLVGSALGAVILPQVQAQTSSGEERILRLSAKLHNPTNAALHDQVVWMYAPMRRTSTQALVDVEATSAFDLVEDRLGQVVAAIRVGRVGPQGMATVGMTARVLLRATAHVERPASNEQWLGFDRLIEIEDPAIREQALRLRRNDPLSTVRAAYEWVAENMRYVGYVADDLGAAAAMRSLSGDCTEYASLLVAMCRINGIPARVAGGFLAPRNVAPRARESHDWAQVYVDGAWMTVDAQMKGWGPPHYVAFHVRGAQDPSNPMGVALRVRVLQPLRTIGD
jgi:hypothetical protein